MSRFKQLMMAVIFSAGTFGLYHCSPSTEGNNEGVTPAQGKGDDTALFEVSSVKPSFNLGDVPYIDLDATTITPVFVSNDLAIKQVLKQDGNEWKPIELTSKIHPSDGILKLVNEEACKEYFIPDEDAQTYFCSDEGLTKAPDCCDDQSYFSQRIDLPKLPVGTYKVVVGYKLDCKNVSSYPECLNQELLAVSNTFTVVDTGINKEKCHTWDEDIRVCRTNKGTVEECVGKSGTDKYNKLQACCKLERWGACSLIVEIPDLTAFDKLTSDDKIQILFPDYVNPDTYEGYTVASVFDETQIYSDALRGKGLKEYQKIEKMLKNTEDSYVTVDAISFNKTIYAYTIEYGAGDNGDGGVAWYHTKIYDRNFKYLGDFSYDGE